MSKGKKIGITLIIIQMVAFIGIGMSDTKPFDNLFSMIGFCLPGILGIYSIIVDDKKKNTAKEIETLEEDNNKKKKEKIIF